MADKVRGEAAQVAYAWWPGLRLMYVSELPGEGGVDWGFTDDERRARDIPPYWARRWLASRRRLGYREGSYGVRPRSRDGEISMGGRGRDDGEGAEGEGGGRMLPVVPVPEGGFDVCVDCGITCGDVEPVDPAVTDPEDPGYRERRIAVRRRVEHGEEMLCESCSCERTSFAAQEDGGR